ncbi:MAG: triple tyrosine motif-containing protein, partial [Saprospiraceae bacterium]
DGYKFKIFRHDADDPASLSDSYIQSLCEDVSGKIWVGSSSGTVDLFDHKTGKFQHIIQETNTPQKTPNGPVNQILVDKSGNIVVQFRNKVIFIKNSVSDKKDTINFDLEEVLFPPGLLNPFITILKTGTIYLFQNLSSVYYEFLQASREWSARKMEYESLTYTGKPEKLNIYRAHEDTVTQKLYIICNLGIIRFYHGKAEEIILKYPVQLLQQSFMDKDMNIWFCKHDTLSIFNITKGKLKFLTSSDEANKVNVILANCTFVDRSGMIWIGSKGYGIVAINYRARQFHHMDNTSVFSILETSDNKIIVNSGNNLGKTLDLATSTYTDSINIHKAKRYFDNFNELTFPSITDKKHHRWFTDHQRLAYIDLNTKQTRSYTLPLKQTNYDYSMVSDLKEDEAGSIWVATMEGLFCLNPDVETWRIYKTDPSDKSSLSFNSTFSLCFDPVEPSRYLWIGTNGGGLNRMDMSTGKFERYTVKNGLPNNVIYGILRDNRDNLWMSTNKGLSCFNVRNQTFKNYEDKDGLQSNEFNHNAFLRSTSGILFFGGVNGYNYFNPDEIETNQIAPKIAITDLLIRNKSINSGQLNGPSPEAPYLGKKIILPYRDNMITFEFAALDYTAPPKNQYQYRMEGFDHDWVNSGNIHSATYTNLDPGTYTFKVKGSNKDGIWSEQSASVLITIIPPWYMTWWFRSLIVALLFLSAYAFYKYRLNQTLKLMAIRNRIATDLHDEIGSNLSNIAIFSEVAQHKSDDKNDLLKKISSYTQTSMDAMNDIVWMVNTRNDRFENIINRMRQLAGEVLEAKGYSVQIDIDERINSFSMNMEERKNFYLIYKETVNNIAKYALGSEVRITMKVNQDDVMLSIKDNGVGFDTKTINSGNGLINLRTRANALKGQLQVQSMPGEGTEIILKFKV